LATSSEHQIKLSVIPKVAEYLKFREKIRDNMTKKFMYTKNTIKVLDNKRPDLKKHIIENHKDAEKIFEQAKKELFDTGKVVELPDTCKSKADIKNFIASLSPETKIIFLTQKKYGNKGLAAVCTDIQNICKNNYKFFHPFSCQFNKQKEEMSHPLYFNSTVGIIFQIQMLKDNFLKSFDYDPGVFNLFINSSSEPVYSMSRRMDGSYPTSVNPIAVWEVKEYYDNKTYGSRINDSIYETILSGKECLEVEKLIGKKIYHILFVDAYYALGILGRALLLRYIDCFFQNIVDDIIVGYDVYTIWPVIADEIIRQKKIERGQSLFSGI
jgi:hypothetical protein